MRYLLLLILLLITGSFAFPQSYTFMHLSAKQGLAPTAINDIYQDELGTMWFATRGGLNRYDGNKNTVFNPSSGDVKFPVLSSIKTICGDGAGTLYLYMKTMSRFVSFDMMEEQFKTIVPDGVSAIGSGKNGVWVAMKNKLYLFDTKKKKLEHIHTLEQLGSITFIYEDTKGICWLGTDSEFFSFDSNKTLTRYFSDREVSKMLEDEHGNRWIISSKGLIKRNSSGEMKIFNHEPGNSESLVSDNIRAGCIDAGGFLWIGSRDGLCRMNPKTEKFETFDTVYGRDFGLNSQSVMCLYADKRGTVWVGTYFKGVNYLDINKQPFRFYHERNGIPFPVVGKFAEDKRGTIWICTEGGALCSLNPETRKFESYTEEKNGLKDLNYKSVRYDETEDCLWLVSIYATLTKFDLKTKRATVYNYPSNLLFKNTIDAVLYEDRILLGTRHGLAVFNPKTGQTERFLQKDTHLKHAINSMAMDSRKRLWIATDQKGVKVYDFASQTIISFEHTGTPNGISANEINLVFEDSKKRIWIGTRGGGLNLYREKTNDFQIFKKENQGFVDDNIVALAESPSGLLLVGSALGFSTFNTKDGSVHNYDYNTGFPLLGVNDGSIFVDSKENIYVGGVDGMTVFSEKDLQSGSPKPFNIELSRLYVDNKEVKRGDDSGILETTLPYTKEITLKHGYSVFSVEFATDEYVRSEFGAVEYRLKGYDEQWLSADFGRLLTYTNLSSGKYTLELRPKAFPDIRKALVINILPPFYFTWPFFLLYLAIIAGVGFWLLKEMRIRFFLKKSLEYEQREKLRNEELIQTKLRFFTNVSHEFRTPITLIMGQAEILLNSHNIHPVVHSKILNIQKNAGNLKALITELLDFSKQEEQISLKLTVADFIPFVGDIYNTFKEHAQSKRINFQFRHPDKELLLSFDAEQMQKVVNNLLINAFKYVADGGNITISLTETDQEVILKVEDDGVGISPEAVEHIFDRFYQANVLESTAGTGIGLTIAKGVVDAHRGKITVESTPEKGSVFTVYLKKEAEKPFENTAAEEPETAETNPTQGVQEEEQPQKSSEMSSVLIVEDNDELREILYESFCSLYKTETAVDGLDAWEKIQQKEPDIIICDIMMPRMSGIELCTRLKNNFETCHIPIIILTAKTADEHKFEGLRIGVDDYLVKPFDIRMLVMRCNNLINNRKILQQKFIHNADFVAPQMAVNVSDRELMEKAASVVLSELQNDKFDVDQFAQMMNLGRTTFFNKLKSITGLTPNQYITNIRLKKAAELLKGNLDMNVSDVAYQVGFNSPYYFSKCFKELFGTTPVAYRKSTNKQ